MTKELAKYEAAKRALAETRSVDEVKDIRNKSVAMKLYAKQAKDKKLEADAAEIRLRAERRIGEMMAAQPKAKAGRKGNRVSEKPNLEEPATLAEAGIDKNLADRSRKAAAMPEENFEQEVAEERASIIEHKPRKVNAKDPPKLSPSEKALRFLIGFIAVFGRPTAPIEIRETSSLPSGAGAETSFIAPLKD